jgi:hypothetical protein
LIFRDLLICFLKDLRKNIAQTSRNYATPKPRAEIMNSRQIRCSSECGAIKRKAATSREVAAL